MISWRRRFLGSRLHEVLLALVGLISMTTASLAQMQNANLPPGFENGRSNQLAYESAQSLLIDAVSTRGELRVTAIDPQSPVLRLIDPNNPNQIVQLEVGDRIRSIDGNATRTIDDLHTALQGGNDRYQIEVVDHRSNQTSIWIVQPSLTERPTLRQSQEIGRQSRVFAIIAGLTDDPTIGPSIELSVDELSRDLRNQIDGERITVVTLTGGDCSAVQILSTILMQPTNADDTILIYFLGHGAFDPNFAQNDPSGGHFFQIPNGDLLRRTVWDHLNAMPARSRLLITDTCNVQSIAKLDQRFAAEVKVVSKVVRGPTNHEWLLLGHAGKIDISAASPNQYAWFSSDLGGWFSHSFLGTSQQPDNWDTLVSRLPNATQETFARKRQEFLSKPDKLDPEVLARLTRQRNMLPVIRNNLVRDSEPPIPLNAQRTMMQEIVMRREIP